MEQDSVVESDGSSDDTSSPNGFDEEGIDDSGESSGETSEGSDEEADDGANQQDHSEQESSTLDPKILTLKLIKRTRALISIIHQSSVLDHYVREQIRLKRQESSQRGMQDGREKITFGELIRDFCVRWNSTYLMLKRFIVFRSIINEITHTPDQIDVIKPQQARTLSKFAFSHSDWNWLIAVEHVLQPFEQATRMLSGRHYQTLAIKQLALNGLKRFLTTYKPGEVLVNILKRELLVQYEYYCEQSVSTQEKEAMLVGMKCRCESITNLVASLHDNQYDETCIPVVRSFFFVFFSKQKASSCSQSSFDQSARVLSDL